MLLFFVKFNFAYQLYAEDYFNITSSPEFHKHLCNDCKKFRDRECPKEFNDEDILDCSVAENWKILYCEPPKILNENNECVLEISSEKWRKIMKNSTAYLGLIYLDNVDKRRFGKVLSKRILTIEDGLESYLAAIGKTSEGSYNLFDLKTCFEQVGDRNWDDLKSEAGLLNLNSILKISTPQVISIIFFLLLLIIYLTIEELRKTVHGQCWINFLVNSLINYLAAIVQLVNIIMEENSFVPYSTLRRDTKRTKYIENFTFKVSSTFVIYTEFSLYFWLNITFFEAFYTLR
jgi:hypothetical protein